MLNTIKQVVARDKEEGFTLIELMVVVLIIAILLAIAIPTFLGARNSANSRAAQSSLRNALTAEQTYWTNNQAFGTSASTPSISTIEPNLNWIAAGPASTNSSNDIYAVVVDNGNQSFLQAYAKDGNCYTIFQNNDSGITIANGNTGYDVQKGACTAVTQAAATAITSLTVGKASSDTSGTKFYTTW